MAHTISLAKNSPPNPLAKNSPSNPSVGFERDKEKSSRSPSPVPSSHSSIDQTGWWHAKKSEVLVGSGGVFVALVPQLLSSSRKLGATPLAPSFHQALLTVGLTIASFCQVSTLRRFGGDPHGYRYWRAISLGTVASLFYVDVVAGAFGCNQGCDMMLTLKSIPSTLAIASSGSSLQTTLDWQPSDAKGVRRRRQDRIIYGGMFASAIVWQAGDLSTYTNQKVHEAGSGLLPANKNTENARQAIYLAAMCMVIAGTFGGLVARSRRNESMRVAGFAFALASVPIALIGVTL